MHFQEPMESLHKIVISRYPNLDQHFRIESNNGLTLIKLSFKNNRYFGWIEQDVGEGFIVGINELHGHFDSGTENENLELALDYFDGIVNNEIAAVGLKEKSFNYLLSTLPLEQAISRYGLEKPKIEIETFSKSH